MDAYEQAKWFGDDRATAGRPACGSGKPIESAVFVVRRLGAGRPLVERARLGATFPGAGRQVLEDMFGYHWGTADALAERLGVDEAVRDSVAQTFERWDVKAEPDGARGEEVLIASTVGEPGRRREVFHRAGGVEAVVAVAEARRGTQLDPGLVELFRASAPELFEGACQIFCVRGVA